ncbi:glycosyltransferase family 4 protein [Actinotalea sp.]|uniref:glycosyltransferase family 4 protein n=1 Tax=Actinotalea sp. TaxID=1872145 RepID=UPI0035623FF2
MRIAIAFDCFFPLSTGGGERLYRLLAESFARHGHEVTYLTRQQWTGPAPSVPGVRVRAVSGRTGLYDEHGNRRLLPALRFAAGLVRYLARHRGSHDVVLVSALPVLNVFAVRLALAGSRTLVCADFLEVWRREQWLEYSGPVVGRVAATLQRWAARVSPLVSCHSRLHAERLVADGTPNAPLVSPGLIHGAVLGPANEAAAEPPTVVYVGRHIPDKQVDAIPAAVAWARTQIPTLRAVVLGDGGQRRAVQAEVDRLGLTEDVTLPGFVEQEELDRHLAAAACLVNPSRREGYGLVVVEAAAHGTPVVLVDAPDNAAVELVEDGVNGVVATSLAPEVLGAALVRVVLAGPTMRSTTRAWYERAVRERTVEVTAERLLAAFAESRRR